MGNKEQVSHLQVLPAIFKKQTGNRCVISKYYLPYSRSKQGTGVSSPSTTCHIQEANREQVSHLQVLPAIFKKANREQVSHLQVLPAIFKKANREQVCHFQVLLAIFQKANREQVCHFQVLPAIFKKANREQVCHFQVLPAIFQKANREQVCHFQVLPAIFQKANREQVCHFQVLPAIFKKANREQVCHSKYYLPYSRRQTGNRCVISKYYLPYSRRQTGNRFVIPSTTCYIQESKQGTGVSFQVLPAIFQKANRVQECHSKCYLPYSRRQTGNRCIIPSTTCHIPKGKQGTGVSFQVLPAIFQKTNREQVCHPKYYLPYSRRQTGNRCLISKYYLPYSRRQTGNRCVIPSTTCHIPEGKQGTGVSFQVLPAIFQKSGVNSGLLIPELVCILSLVTTLWFVGFLRTDM